MTCSTSRYVSDSGYNSRLYLALSRPPEIRPSTNFASRMMLKRLLIVFGSRMFLISEMNMNALLSIEIHFYGRTRRFHSVSPVNWRCFYLCQVAVARVAFRRPYLRFDELLSCRMSDSKSFWLRSDSGKSKGRSDRSFPLPTRGVTSTRASLRRLAVILDANWMSLPNSMLMLPTREMNGLSRTSE